MQGKLSAEELEDILRRYRLTHSDWLAIKGHIAAQERELEEMRRIAMETATDLSCLRCDVLETIAPFAKAPDGERCYGASSFDRIDALYARLSKGADDAG